MVWSPTGYLSLRHKYGPTWKKSHGESARGSNPGGPLSRETPFHWATWAVATPKATDLLTFSRAYTGPTPPDFGEKTQTEVARARHKIIWTGQDCPTGNSTRREAKRQTEETMGRQHQRVDWPSMEQHPTES